MDYKFPELGSKHRLNNDVIDGKPITFTTKKTRLGFPIRLLMIFLKCGGKRWGLEDFWTQFVVLTGHSTAVADFTWSTERISVSIIFHSHKNNSDLMMIVWLSLRWNWVGLKAVNKMIITFLYFASVIASSLFYHTDGTRTEELEQSKLYSVEFRIIWKCKTMSICFWEGAHSDDVQLCSIPRDILVVKGERVKFDRAVAVCCWQ